MALTEKTRGLIVDLDNTLYRKPGNNNDIFAKAAAQGAINLGFEASYTRALELARESGELYKSETAIFWREFCLDRRAIFIESHRLGVVEMCQAVRPSAKLAQAFNRLANEADDLVILSHGSQFWVETMVRHLGLTGVRSGRIFGLDHQVVSYRTKDEGPDAYITAADIMNLPRDAIAVIEDTVPNLLHAHALGMAGIHIHWGRPLDFPPAHVHSQVRSIASVSLRQKTLAGPV